MTVTEKRLPYRPDHASPPGDLIEEYLQDLDISARELARRCGRSGKLIAEIVAGKASVEPETALQLERVLGLSATVWSNMEAAYRLHLAREAERATLDDAYDWAVRFPMKELAERDYVHSVSGRANTVQSLLEFFGVGSVSACEERVAELLQVDFRTSPTFESDEFSLAVWLRIGERKAGDIEVKDYDKDTFVIALKEIRKFTTSPLDSVIHDIVRLCASSGVIFVLEKPLPKIRVSGMSRWLTPRKALIQQSLRYMSDDHFWFTFFHECAHLLLHSRKEIFIDSSRGPGSADPKKEAEANVWASEFLVPDRPFKRFLQTFRGDEMQVRAFADECGIAPGIVVGRLQHDGVIGFDALNNLRTRYKWN